MKLFAKRTKKVAPPSSTKEPRTVFQSDPVCEELLKQDESTWNAKQRRMIRRYQERQKEAATTEKTKNLQNQGETDEATKDDDGQNKEETADVESSSDSSSESSEEEEDSDEDSEKSDDSSKQEVDGTIDSNGSQQKDINTEPKPNQASPEEGAAEPTASSKDDEMESGLAEMLERLDSKNRRKLRRKLDRGEASEADIRKEAMAILEPPKTESPSDGAKRGKQTALAENTAEPTAKKGKKRKADWSTLPPEERMRREEQRRRQQEVAALRVAGDVPLTKHRHPLNSERRRANRRKPKWERKSVGQEMGTNYHNASGFQMRKGQSAA